MKKLFTSESVTKGHPDKICDQISDAILDSYLELDPTSHVACEVSVTENFVLVMGEITSKGIVDIEEIVRKTILDIGYNKDEYGFNGNTCEVLIKLKEQSPDISRGVNLSNKEIGAGDQGIMFGFANNETEEYMPLALSLSHKLAKQLDKVREEKIINYLRPDGKTQVTVEYTNNVLTRIDTILISNQHNDNVTNSVIKKDLIKYVINEVVPRELVDEKTKILINPTGNFVIGGPLGDSGLTGRKIIVDTYGGYAPHGGGAFSGKDSTKVDRSAAYMARHIAKNIVANNLAQKCEIQLSYAIGISEPLSIAINTFNTSKYTEEELITLVKNKFPLTPKGIIDYLDLQKPIYQKLATYGHMGRSDLNVTWESIIKLEI